MASTSKLEDLNVTKDEIKRIGDALKDENFRKLFMEYAQEISDPENRRVYEQEISQMENERGMDVQFVHPKEGHVLETSIDGKSKGFINICQNDKIEKPKSTRQVDANGRSGMMWQIPHSFAHPRDDVNGGEKCEVFDVVFHPDTYRMTETNERFLKLVHDTAIDGIEKQFDVKIDRRNIKRSTMKYKGIPQATVIRSKRADSEDVKDNNSEMSDILKNMTYPYDNTTTKEKMEKRESDIEKKEQERKKKDLKTRKLKENGEDSSTAAVPEYTFTHRSDLDLQEYRNAPDARTSTRPKDLIVQIFLPLLPSASCASLDIFEQRLKLESKEPASYFLDIKLPYPVKEDDGSAKFDKAKRCLTITLPVQPAQVPKLPSFIEDEKRINGDIHESADTSGSENSDLNNFPKIEVLVSSENETKRDNNENNAIQDDSQSDSDLPKLSSPATAYSLPDYTFNQDAETISFIFNVRHISRDTITKSFPNPNSIRITFISLGSGYFPMYYCLYIQFDPSCRLASEHCNTDLSDENLVLVLLKEKSCRTFWDRFQAGLDASQLEEKLLLTDVSLQKQLNQLDEEAEYLERAEAYSGRSPLLEVTEMKNKKLTINIKGVPLDHEDEDDDYDPPSSADIEVVHRKVPPKLHSILKQRTLSESSDDYGCSGGESPRSGQEDCPGLDGQCRKSVSFNNHIDSTTFKKNTAPTSMKTALKSRRRRARKKEEKKTNTRRRRNSGGSEGSSSEELSQTDSISLSDDKEDDDDEAETNEDHFEQIEEDVEGETAEWKKEPIQGAAEESVMAGKDNQDFRTSATSVGSKVDQSDKKKKMVQEIKIKLAATENSQSDDSDDEDDDDDDDDDGVIDSAGLDERTNKDDVSSVIDVCDESQVVCDGMNEMSLKSESIPVSKNEGCDNIVSASAITSQGDLQKIIETQDSSVIRIQAENKDDEGSCVGYTPPLIENMGDNSSNHDNKVDTMLSWNDKGEGMDPFDNDHKTRCAFNFSNSVIYDLDVD